MTEPQDVDESSKATVEAGSDKPIEAGLGGGYPEMTLVEASLNLIDLSLQQRPNRGVFGHFPCFAEQLTKHVIF